MTSFFGQSSTTARSTSTTTSPLTAPTFTFSTSSAEPASSAAEASSGDTKNGNRSVLGEACLFSKLLTPWRRVEWTEEERSSLLERLSSYTPSSQDIPQARVLLLGPVGSGKSSFISSVQSVFNGRVTTRAMVGHMTSSSFTRKLQSFPLRVQDSVRGSGHAVGRRSSGVVLCDMMGFGDGLVTGPTLQHILSVIRGHAPEGYEFRPDQALSSDCVGYIKRPCLKDQMHCVAFVLDASKVQNHSYSSGISSTLPELRRYISDMGVHQVVLLTHIDKICPNTANDTSQVYTSVLVRNTIYKVAELVGISVSSVVPVRNYWCELDVDLSCDLLLLRALDHVLQYTELLFTENKESDGTDKH